MAVSSFDIPIDEVRLLPQYGFGSDFEFATLVKHNRFLFRVYTPRQQGEDTSFIAQKFDESLNRSPSPLPASLQLPSPSSPFSTETLGYDDAARHMNWTTRSSSPFISTSFSFGWAVWEALRRYRENVKHDVEIAVIDAGALTDRAVTALELLRKAVPEERHADYWRWYRFSQEAQTVLVYGCVPASAILSSVPLIALVSSLPSFFLSPSSPMSGSPADCVWPLPSTSSNQRSKASYRHFAITMSERYMRLPVELRLRDATVGSVRLSAAFLRPYFWNLIGGDQSSFTHAVRKVTELAWGVACWADTRGGVLELGDVIEGIVRQLAEEMRERRLSEVEHTIQEGRLQWAIDELENVVKGYEKQIQEHCCEDIIFRQLPTIPEVEDAVGGNSSDGETVVHDHTHERKQSFSDTDTVVSDLPSPPMTPLKPKQRSISPRPGLPDSVHDSGIFMASSSIPRKRPLSPSTLSPLKIARRPSSPTSSDTSSIDIPLDLSLGPSLLQTSQPPSVPASPASSVDISLPEVGEKSLLNTTRPSTPLCAPSEVSLVPEPAKEDVDADALVAVKPVIPSEKAPVHEHAHAHAHTRRHRPGQISIEKVGYVVSGFLIGALVALCVVGTHQRRSLLVAT